MSQYFRLNIEKYVFSVEHLSLRKSTNGMNVWCTTLYFRSRVVQPSTLCSSRNSRYLLRLLPLPCDPLPDKQKPSFWLQRMVQNGTGLYSTTLDCTAPHCTVVYCNKPYCFEVHYIRLFILHHTTLFCAGF